MPKESVCQEADRLVSGNKHESYGPVGKSLTRIAKIWSAILDKEVTPVQVALCMEGLKIARECHKPQRDNLVDMCGYAKVLELYYDEVVESNKFFFALAKKKEEKPCNEPIELSEPLVFKEEGVHVPNDFLRKFGCSDINTRDSKLTPKA